MPFEIVRRVEFGDTDMAGIVHFSNFFRYMEAAETAFLKQCGLNVTWSENGTRYGFPRVSAACDYLLPARFGDELRVEVQVEKIGTKSVSYRFDFWLESNRVAVGRVVAVYCRGTLVPGEHGLESLTIPEAMRAKLEHRSSGGTDDAGRG